MPKADPVDKPEEKKAAPIPSFAAVGPKPTTIPSFAAAKPQPTRTEQEKPAQQPKLVQPMFATKTVEQLATAKKSATIPSFQTSAPPPAAPTSEQTSKTISVKQASPAKLSLSQPAEKTFLNSNLVGKCLDSMELQLSEHHAHF